MKDIVTTLRLMGVTLLICCIAYPAVILAFARIGVPASAQGSLIERDGRIVGSSRIAQAFVEDSYFWPRPSAVDYAADAAGGSNLSPVSARLTERAQQIAVRVGATAKRPVPADLVAASGSGLDPHITTAAARYQVGRVAGARGLDRAALYALIDEHTEQGWTRAIGGAPVVNVLELNLALDRIQ
ncbi:potassium-transporting ATPase subunit KdpC [Salinisphaera sp. T31B1]|uniref:potassium-transporting ATPase subunit KdpC n=1 Tax=Salinisphaera sp. T31B1 TaxID=727963 RepID=UPI003341D275